MAEESTPSPRNSAEIGLLHGVDIDKSPNSRANAILRRGMESTTTSTRVMLIATTLHHLGVLATTSEVLLGRHRRHHEMGLLHWVDIDNSPYSRTTMESIGATTPMMLETTTSLNHDVFIMIVAEKAKKAFPWEEEVMGVLIVAMKMMGLVNSNLPYHHSMGKPSPMIIWSWRCVWIRFFTATAIRRRRRYDMHPLSLLDML